jgi:hypothetical protein
MLGDSKKWSENQLNFQVSFHLESQQVSRTNGDTLSENELANSPWVEN